MDTTCGSLALKGQIATMDAGAVEQLKRAGMIVIAKANMSVSVAAFVHL
jgi:Asp-tRNA(Asn)/Glu-tRNA(Gln) amidotransferase A subunit family amidase